MWERRQIARRPSLAVWTGPSFTFAGVRRDLAAMTMWPPRPTLRQRFNEGGMALMLTSGVVERDTDRRTIRARKRITPPASSTVRMTRKFTSCGVEHDSIT